MRLVSANSDNAQKNCILIISAGGALKGEKIGGLSENEKDDNG